MTSFLALCILRHLVGNLSLTLLNQIKKLAYQLVFTQLVSIRLAIYIFSIHYFEIFIIKRSFLITLYLIYRHGIVPKTFYYSPFLLRSFINGQYLGTNLMLMEIQGIVLQDC